jgi:tetrahydromethanopterin S-methyltransferase subunit G
MIHALRYTEELEKVGFSTEQAKKSVQIWMDLMDQNFATKADFKEHYFMIKNDMMDLREEFKERFDGVDKRCDEIDKRFDGIDKRFDSVDKRCDSIESKFDKRCDAIESKFDTLEYKLTYKLGLMMATSIAVVSAIVGFLR